MTILLILGLLSQGITDLGVITARNGIALESCTNRSDFLYFKVELQALRFPSNSVAFVNTNGLVTLEDLVAMPPGPVIMGVKSVCLDGAESRVALFRLDVRRDPPKPPTARVVGIPNTPADRDSLTNAMRSVRAKPVESPSPPGIAQVQMLPMPNSTNKSYSDHMIEMHQFWLEHQRRRNQ